MQDFSNEDVNVKLPQDLRNGLHYSARTNHPKTTMKGMLVYILEKAGIKRMTDKQLNEKLKGVKN